MIDFFSGITGIMPFTSYMYLAFLAIVVMMYFALPGPKTRSLLLLVVSCFAFMLYSPTLFWVVCSVTLLAYLFALAIHSQQHSSHRKMALLWSGVLFVGSFLVVFKYAGFFAGTINGLTGVVGIGWKMPILKLVMPVGISFWTFQTIAYLVDVYRNKIPAERSILLFATSVLFFPVVTMGPITRVEHLVKQLSKKYVFNYDNMRSGLMLIGWGFFKKLMIADRLAVLVDSVFGKPQSYGGTTSGLLFFVAAVCFAIQLYTDFSGYTDIVRGSSRLFGVELPHNFNAPYFARSVADFWRRWHMTLMDWLKHYVYIPLGGNRKGPVRKQFNILATFLVSGIWHGAGWTYIIWGLLNGFYQVAGQWLTPINNKITDWLGIDRQSTAHKAFQTITTFILITIAWVFFRAGSIDEAIYMVARMFIPTIWIFSDGTLLSLGLSFAELMIALSATIFVFVIDYYLVERRVDIFTKITAQPLWARWLCYYALIFIVMIFGHYGGTYDATNFMYFKF